MIKTLSNKEIVFIYEFMKEYLITLNNEEIEGEKRRKDAYSMVKYSGKSKSEVSDFLDAMDKIASLGFELIKQRKEILLPILEQFETTYDMIVEAEPELLAEIRPIISGEESKKHFNDILNTLK